VTAVPRPTATPGTAAARRTLLEWFAETVAVDVPNSRMAAALDTRPDEPWATWLGRAAATLGWQSERVVASPRAVEGERDAWWVTQAPGEGERWLVLAGAPGEGTQASVVDGWNARDVSVDAARLSRELSLAGPDDEVSWVRLAPALPLEPLRSPEPDRPLEPLRRLGRWTRLERRTLLAVIAYSTVIGGVSLALPLAVQSLVNLLAFGRVLQPLLVISAALLLVLSLAAGLRVLEVYIVELLQRRAFTDLARDLARRLPAARPDAGGPWGLTERINRLFDIVGVQKSASFLLLSATEVVMSTAAGLLVLGFYHPYLLVYDLVLIGSLAWVLFGLGKGGIDTAVEESHAKYELAAWLESVARQQSRFVSPEGAGWSARRTDRQAVEWLTRRSRHFGIVLRQTIGFAAIQALASATLLGLGSFLVWNNQLSLGQLVAAELIITGVVAQLAKFGKHVESFYDLNASVDKIGMLIDLETEPATGELPPARNGGAAVHLSGVRIDGRTTSFDAEPGERVALEGLHHLHRRELFDVLHARHPPPGDGVATFDGVSLASLAPRALRESVALIGRGIPVGATLEENLTSGDAGATADDLRDVLRRVGLEELLATLSDGLETWVYPDGAPLDEGTLVQLEVARAIRKRPRLVLVDRALDGLDPRAFDAAWDALTGSGAGWTLLVATSHPQIAARCARRLRWDERTGSLREGDRE